MPNSWISYLFFSNVSPSTRNINLLLFSYVFDIILLSMIAWSSWRWSGLPWLKRSLFLSTLVWEATAQHVQDDPHSSPQLSHTFLFLSVEKRDLRLLSIYFSHKNTLPIYFPRSETKVRLDFRIIEHKSSIWRTELGNPRYNANSSVSVVFHFLAPCFIFVTSPRRPLLSCIHIWIGLTMSFVWSRNL